MRYSLVLFAAIIMLVSQTVATEVSDGVGIYFDAGATTNCLPDVDSFPYVTNVYVILKSMTSEGGLSGWEGLFSCDDGLYLSSVSFAGDAINVAVFPECLVGLAESLAANTTVTLATIQIVASNPGGIYFCGASTPSIPGSLFPLYADGAIPDSLKCMSYTYGGLLQPLAWIGEGDCPFKNEGFEYFMAGGGGSSAAPDANTEYDKSELHRWDLKQPSTFKKSQFWNRMLAADLVAKAEALGIQYICQSSGHPRLPPESHALMDIKLIELYKGFSNSNVLTIKVLNTSNPECALYYNDLHPEKFVVNDEYLFGISHYAKEAPYLRAYNGLVFCYIGQEISACSDYVEFDGFDPEDEMHDAIENTAISAQYKGADLVLVVTDLGVIDLASENGNHFSPMEAAVLSVLKGDYSDSRIVFYAYNPISDCEAFSEPHHEPGHTAVVFLNNDGSEYYLSCNRLSYLRTDGVKLYTSTGFFTGHFLADINTR